MRYKTKEVPPYTNTFRVFNKSDRKVHVEFVDLNDAVDFVYGKVKIRYYNYERISFTLKDESDFVYAPYSYYSKVKTVYTAKASPWVILTDLGDIVSKEEINEARRSIYKYRDYHSRWDRYELNRKRLNDKKGSGLKIKGSYKTVEDVDRHGDVSYTNLVRSYGRRPNTTQEKRMSEAHMDEYGENIVRGGRRPHSLPCSWSDYPVSAWGTEKSWKHNSKRRKQWIPA